MMRLHNWRSIETDCYLFGSPLIIGQAFIGFMIQRRGAELTEEGSDPRPKTNLLLVYTTYTGSLMSDVPYFRVPVSEDAQRQ